MRRWRAPSAAQAMDARLPGMSSLVQRLQQVPTPVIDAGLAVALAVAITIAISVSPEPGAQRDLAASVLGWTIAALVLVRRRWPLAVLLASAIILQLYYQLDYPGIYPAVPLSVPLATAWAAGHRRWSLAVAGFFVVAGVGVGYQALAPDQPALQVLGDVSRDIVLFAAVLLLGEAVRTRRALALEQQRSERLLLNILPAPIATRLKRHEDVIADGFGSGLGLLEVETPAGRLVGQLGGIPGYLSMVLSTPDGRRQFGVMINLLVGPDAVYEAFMRVVRELSLIHPSGDGRA